MAPLAFSLKLSSYACWYVWQFWSVTGQINRSGKPLATSLRRACRSISTYDDHRSVDRWQYFEHLLSSDFLDSKLEHDWLHDLLFSPTAPVANANRDDYGSLSTPLASCDTSISRPQSKRFHPVRPLAGTSGVRSRIPTPPPQSIATAPLLSILAPEPSPSHKRRRGWCNAFLLFRSHFRSTCGSMHETDVSRAAGVAWAALSETEKAPWEAKSEEKKKVAAKPSQTDGGKQKKKVAAQSVQTDRGRQKRGASERKKRRSPMSKRPNVQSAQSVMPSPELVSSVRTILLLHWTDFRSAANSDAFSESDTRIFR